MKIDDLSSVGFSLLLQMLSFPSSFKATWSKKISESQSPSHDVNTVSNHIDTYFGWYTSKKSIQPIKRNVAFFLLLWGVLLVCLFLFVCLCDFLHLLALYSVKYATWKL